MVRVTDSYRRPAGDRTPHRRPAETGREARRLSHLSFGQTDPLATTWEHPWPAIKCYEATLNPDCALAGRGADVRWRGRSRPHHRRGRRLHPGPLRSHSIPGWTPTAAAVHGPHLAEPGPRAGAGEIPGGGPTIGVRRTNSTDFGWFATFPTHDRARRARSPCQLPFGGPRTLSQRRKRAGPTTSNGLRQPGPRSPVPQPGPQRR